MLRTIVFVDANDNNRSTTVESLFLQAVETYGYPTNVRTDLGSENVLVWRHMHSHWGTERRSVIVGSSVHNQRVERFNRDLNVNITQVVCPKLKELEDAGLLDINNETDMFCLHYASVTESFSNVSIVDIPRTTCPVTDEEFRLAIVMATKMRNMTCARTETSKVPI